MKGSAADKKQNDKKQGSFTYNAERVVGNGSFGVVF
jgi:serine/threonine protein kinase